MTGARQTGYAYLFLLYLVALLAIGALAVTGVEHCARVRTDEAELLRIGDEYRRALDTYYLAVTPHVYPASLEDLLQDERGGTLRRHLRKIYVDPMTRTSDWGQEILAGRIVGFHSLSKGAPLKIAGFGDKDLAFAGAKQYSDWLFLASGEQPGPVKR